MRLRTALPVIALAIIGLVLGLSGCDELVTEEIIETVFGTPRAEFTADKEFCCNPPCTVQFFEDTSWGRRDSRTWTFGDGGTDTVPNPIHVYDSAGAYTVTLVVDDSQIEWQDSEQKKRFIIVGNFLDSFIVDSTEGCLGLEVTFTPIWGGAIDTFTWVFGDGDTVSVDTAGITHVYDSVGLFDVSLHVSGDCGVGTYGKAGLIQIYDCPTVAFESSDTVGCAPLTVTFFDATDPLPDSTRWEFTNGFDTVTQNPEVTFTTAGVYGVSQTAWLGDAVTTVSVDSFLTVSDSTNAAFTMSTSAGCRSDFQQFQVRFTNTSAGELDSVRWDFGDGFASTELDPVHAFTTPGIYEVLLEAFGPCGNDAAIDSVIFSDTLNAVPFTTSADTVVQGSSVDFTDNVTGVVVNRRWAFGDGSSADNAPPNQSHLYTEAGTFPCTLTVTNTCNTVEIIDTVVVTVP